MRRALLATAAAGLLLAGCGDSSSGTSSPLAHVPADTPYLFATYETPDEAALETPLASLDAQIDEHRRQLTQAADALRDDGAESMAGLLAALAGELEGKQGYRQVADSIGVDLYGLSAFYGLGLTPVLRLGVDDPQRYRDFLDRLAKAAGATFETRDLDGTDYRRVPLADTPLQLISAVHDGRAVLALAPDTLDDTLLSELLGDSLPEKSASDTLTKLADAKGYLPYGTGYIDTQRLVTLLIGDEDPLVDTVKAMREQATGQAPTAVSAACRADAERIAGWVPQLSLGYTALEADHVEQRMDVSLMSDIAKPFATLRTPLPGLGAATDAPFDMAMALPMPTLRTVLREQIDSLQAKPFECPQLAELNGQLDELGQRINMLAMPPFGDLRGVRLILDAMDTATNGIPDVKGAAIIAASNPDGLLAMGQSMVPQLAELRLTPDSGAVSLPQQWLAMLNGQPGWAAMSDKALGVAVGDGEKTRLTDQLQGDDADAGHLMHLRISGAMYLQWLDMTQGLLAMQGNRELADELDSELASARAQFEHIDAMNIDVRMADSGLVLESRVDWKE
ncbi:hypothetical protein [Modicisalibacter coralii]|uniref:hypothetical protein n=1 Tax=Modicisalibacter coralii TaxID=2304602 RepID=UPI00100ABC20|nr:hypothetical protein [Halomonas coralii]